MSNRSIESGFPSVQGEARLKNEFFSTLRPVAIQYLTERKLRPNLYKRPVENFISFFYGIYFYDYISGGRIINLDLSGAYRLKLENLGLNGPNLYNLNSWPVTLVKKSMSNEAFAQTGARTRLIKASLTDLLTIGCYEPVEMDCREASHKRKGISYKINSGTFWIVTGIEEASHDDLINLELKHYGIDPDDYERVGAPLRSVEEQTGGRDLIDYYAADGIEWAAHIVVSQYVKYYCPEDWANGFKAYDKAVRKNRKKLLAESGYYGKKRTTQRA